MKNLILILAIAFVAMFSSLRAEEEILWKSHYRGLIDPNGAIDPGYIYNAIFTPEDKYIVVSCERRTFLVEAETGKYVRDIKDVAGVIRFSNDGKYIYTYDNRKINFETGEVVGTFTNKGEKLPRFTNMDICEKAGVMIATLKGSPQNWTEDIYIFDLATMDLIEKLGDKYTNYGHLYVAQDGSFFQTFGDYDSIQTPPKPSQFRNEFWDIKLRKKMFDAKAKGMETISLSPDGNWIGSVSGNKVSIFAAKSYEEKWGNKHEGSSLLSGLAFSSNSKYFITCAISSDIELWSIENGKSSYRYSNGSKGLMSQSNLAFSNNGKYILGFQNGGIAVYNAIYSNTKVDPIVSNDTLQVYPNPSNRKIRVEINIEINYSIKIVNQVGKEIQVVSNVENSILEIDISNVENGTYYLVLIQNNISKLYKFVKE